jgi:hypothetical protein
VIVRDMKRCVVGRAQLASDCMFSWSATGICTMCGRKVMDTSKYKMSLK